MSARDRLDALFKGQSELDLTSGGIARPLFYLSLPIVVTNLLQVAYNLADTFWLGRYSTPALAAISFGFPMVYLLISLGLGISVTGSVLVAQHTGAGNPRQAEYAASQTMVFAVAAASVFGAVSYLFVGDLLALFGATPEVLSLATTYMEIISLGLPLLFGFLVFIALMRGAGDTLTPMLVMLGTVVVNIALDPFLIFGWGPFPELGVAGAAIATVFARGSAMLTGLVIMFRGRRGVRIRRSELRPDPAFLGKLLRIGVPASVENTGRAVSVNVLLFIVGLFSTTVIAAFGVGLRVFSLIFMPAIAVDRGVETMTGQNIGAGKPDRAARTSRFAARATFLILAAVGVVVFATAPQVMRLFTADAAVVREGARFLRWVAPTFGFMGVMRAYSGGFRGAGRTLTAAVIVLLVFGGVRLTVAWVGAGALGPDGIWLAFPVSNVVAATIALAWYTRGRWRDASVTDPPGDPAPEADADGDANPDPDPDPEASPEDVEAPPSGDD